MVFWRDEGSVFEAPLDQVWEFLDDPEGHTRAHEHTEVSRERTGPETGTYSWRQPFEGVPTRFTMRWRSFHPLGIAYDVVEGPFDGSRFFLYYLPLGSRTGIAIVGEFRSPTLGAAELPAALDRFFAKEFDQDRQRIESRTRRTASG